MSKNINKDLNDVANNYAKANGYKNAQDMNEKIADGLNSGDINVRNATDRAARLVTSELLPMLFNQIVQSNPSYGDLKGVIDSYYNGQKSEGNGFSVSNVLATGPTSEDTVITNGNSNFVPDANTILKSKPITQEYQVNFFTATSTPDALTLAPEGYAFYKEMTINNIKYKQHWRSGAGVQWLANWAATLYDSYIIWKFDKITKRLLPSADAQWSQNPNCTYTTTKTNAYECWVDIIAKIKEFMMLTNEYNFDANYKKLQSSNFDNFRIFVSQRTVATLESGVKTQLFNTQFLAPKILEKLEVINARVLTVDTTNNNIYTTTQANYVKDTEIFIIHNDAFGDWNQTQETASQFFARNFENFTNYYVVGAAKYVPDGKVLRIKAAHLNDNI